MPRSIARDPAEAYRRCARRLRSELGAQPGKLYRSLRDLSERYDRQFPFQAPATIIAPDPADDLAAQIAARIHDGVLSYSDRLHLLEVASRAGIGRFEANLIIASVQHRIGAATPAPATTSERRFTGFELLLTFLLVQLSILVIGWAMLFH